MSFFHFFSLVNVQARFSLKAEASVLYLSYLWWILEPILFVLVFYFVFEVLLKIGKEDFLLFLMCGKIPFLWFSKSVILASNSIKQNKGLINQVHLSKALFPYVAIQGVLYKQWAVFAVLLSFVIFSGLDPEMNWLWLLPLMLVQYLLILLFGLLAAVLVSYISDMRMLIGMFVTFLLFSSGIFWDVNLIADIELRMSVLTYNPLAFLIDGYRQVLMNRTVYDIDHLCLLGVGILSLLLIVHFFMMKFSKNIAKRVLNS